MFEATSSVLSIFAVVGKVQGRKKIQKMVHLLDAAGNRMPFKYEYHHYGPYSAELQAELNDLSQKNLLHEDIQDETYVYEITDKGREYKAKLDRLGFEVSIDAELVKSLAKKSSQFPEMVSTYAFLLNSGLKPQEAREKALELKFHLKDYIDSAIDFYNRTIVPRSN